MSEVNVEKIMEEIRAEVRAKGEAEVPGMEDLPVSTLRQFDWTVSSAYPVTGGNPIKRLYTKMMSKLVRCALFPMGNRLTQIHEEMALRMDELVAMNEEQGRQIAALQEKVKELESRSNK